jgi:hypothetical protein
MFCSFCRGGFTVPTCGVWELPKNTKLIEKVRAKREMMAKQQRFVCDSCSDVEEDSACPEGPSATKHCIVCHDNLCSDCVHVHTKFKESSEHELVDFDQLNDDDVMRRASPIASKLPFI